MKERQVNFLTQICHSCLAIFNYSNNNKKYHGEINEIEFMVTHAFKKIY